MAVSLLGSAWEGSTGLSGVDPTHSHTVEAGSDRCLVAVMTWGHGGAVSPAQSAMTYGGQAMTKLVESEWDNGATAWRGASLWYIAEAGIAAAADSTFGYTWGTIPDGGIHIRTRFFAGVYQTTPFVASGAGASGGGFPPQTTSQVSPAMTYADGDMGVYGGGSGNIALTATVDESYTEDYDEQTTVSVNGGHKAFTGTGSTQITVVWSNDTRRAVAAGVLSAKQGLTGGSTGYIYGTPTAVDPDYTYNR